MWHVGIYKQFHCDCFIQVDYLIGDDGLTKHLWDEVEQVLQKYSGKISIDHFRLIESGSHTTAAFDLLYPAGLQKSEETICQKIDQVLAAEGPQYCAVIKGILRRERYGSCRRYKFNTKGTAEHGDGVT